LPDERSIRPLVIGDTPALADLFVTLGSTNIPTWGLLAWWQRAAVWNLCSNGDFEDDVDGWSVAAVAGVTGAATSIARSTTAARNKYGGANAQIVCPATANTGATFKINRRFYSGRGYLLLVWASSAAGTTNARGRIGVSGDISNTPTVALTTTPTLYSQIWTPTVDRDGAYACFEITAATGTTLNIDGVVVLEARLTTLSVAVNSSETAWTVLGPPDDWPPPPFLAIIGPGTTTPEIVRVEAVVGAVLTVVRGLEGTAGASHTTSDPIFPLPSLQYHLEGKGAQPPAGVIEAESADAGNLFTWAVTADATKRLGNYLYKSAIGAAGSAAADWLVDPHLLVQDDYTQGELAVVVWARLVIHSGLTAPVAILSAAPESATVSSGVMSSNFGAIRYAEEWGASGKALVKPSSGEVVRFVRLGTMRFPVDRSKPLRWRLQLRITWTGGAAATVGCDYLMLVPTNGHCLGATAKPNDANFPKFIASASETTKTIRSDLSGLVSKPPGAGQADHGLGGSLIELPYGATDWLVKTSTLVPDDPTSDTTTETDGGAITAAGVVHLAVTPRFRTARSS
jgi:hypothetical protein